MGTVFFCFANLRRRLGIELLRCVWPMWCYWWIAVHFRFLASKALHCTLYHAEHFSFFVISVVD